MKYIAIVAMSLIIVAKGPDAKAGSRLSFLNKKGRNVEMKTAATMLKNMERPTIRPSVELRQPIKVTAVINNPQADASENATTSSLRK